MKRMAMIRLLLMLMVVFPLACARRSSDYALRLQEIRSLNAGNADALVARAKGLCRTIAFESSQSLRDKMIDELIERVVSVDFSAPSRANTPDWLMVAYSRLLYETSKGLFDFASAEKVLAGMLRGRKRFEQVLPHVGAWTHECYPSPTDWGCPPETDEILGCLRSGDVEGTNASPRVRKMLGSMSADVRKRFPEIVKRALTSADGGARGQTFTYAIVEEMRLLERAIERQFLTAWDRTLSPSQSMALQSMFESAVGRKPELRR